jgi:hypothetical protein
LCPFCGQDDSMSSMHASQIAQFARECSRHDCGHARGLRYCTCGHACGLARCLRGCTSLGSTALSTHHNWSTASVVRAAARRQAIQHNYQLDSEYRSLFRLKKQASVSLQVCALCCSNEIDAPAGYSAAERSSPHLLNPDAVDQ